MSSIGMKRNVNLHCEVQFHYEDGVDAGPPSNTSCKSGSSSATLMGSESSLVTSAHVYSHFIEEDGIVMFWLQVAMADGQTGLVIRSLDEFQMLDSSLKKAFGRNYKSSLPISPMSQSKNVAISSRLGSSVDSNDSMLMNVLSPVAVASTLMQFFSIDKLLGSDDDAVAKHVTSSNLAEYCESLTKYLRGLLRTAHIEACSLLQDFLCPSDSGLGMDDIFEGAAHSHTLACPGSADTDDGFDDFVRAFARDEVADADDELVMDSDEYCANFATPDIPDTPKRKPSPVPMLDLSFCSSLDSADAIIRVPPQRANKGISYPHIPVFHMEYAAHHHSTAAFRSFESPFINDVMVDAY
jgi:hypothetical protein